MKLTGQARIYWRNLQATTERRHDPMITSWAEMKSRLREKFVTSCYRPMIIDEWQHLRQGEGTVEEYIARFDDLMIHCNMDEEPMATLARFRAGLRSEFQRELVLQEVSTLEKAYRYTLNMELYTAHTQRGHTPWIVTMEVIRYVQSGSRNPLPTPSPPVNMQTTSSPPPPRLLLPTHPTTPSTTPTSNTRSRLRTSPGPPTTRFGVHQPSANERTLEGRAPGGIRPRPPPASRLPK